MTIQEFIELVQIVYEDANVSYKTIADSGVKVGPLAQVVERLGDALGQISSEEWAQ